jgi:O-succinylbenzoate synthase
MTIVAVDHRTVRWPIEARGAARGVWRERAAVVVIVRDDTGAVGVGEAAPLPGVSTDELADAERAAQALAALVPFELDTAVHATAIADTLTRAPAARFAVETALLAVLAQRNATSVASLIVATPLDALRCAVVVDDADEARAAIAAGAPCLKIKAGPPGHVEHIARAVPGTRLRVDANRAWSRADAIGRIAALADLPIDFIEEPCVAAHELLATALPIRIALDESVAELDRRTLDRALGSPQLAALVLKPTVLGGFARCLELAAAAHRHGVAPIVSHALEGPIGFAACHELARAIAADVPAGLGPHPALAHFCEAT